MQRIPFWQAPWLSFHSERPYVAAARQWRGLALGYLAVLAALVWLPNAASLQQDLTWIRETFVPAVIDDLPRIEIRDGQAFVMAETPMELTGPDGDLVAILDPDADPDRLDEMTAGLLLTRTHLYVETFQGTRSLDLSTIGNAVITPDTVRSAASATTIWIGWLVYPVGAAFNILYRVVQVLIYAIATVVLGRTVGIGLSYAAAARLTAIAITPVIFLALVQDVTGFVIPAWWIVAVATTFIYVYFGVRGVADGDEASRAV